MSKKDKKLEEFIVKISSQIEEMFDDECENHISKDDVVEYSTEFVHALANVVPTILHNKFTGEKINMLQFNHIANQLCFQFSVKK